MRGGIYVANYVDNYTYTYLDTRHGRCVSKRWQGVWEGVGPHGVGPIILDNWTHTSHGACEWEFLSMFPLNPRNYTLIIPLIYKHMTFSIPLVVET